MASDFMEESTNAMKALILKAGQDAAAAVPEEFADAMDMSTIQTNGEAERRGAQPAFQAASAKARQMAKSIRGNGLPVKL